MNVRVLFPFSNAVREFPFDPNVTIGQLKREFKAICIMFQDKMFQEDALTLAQIGVAAGSVIQVMEVQEAPSAPAPASSLPQPFPVNPNASFGPVLESDYQTVEGAHLDIKWRQNEPFAELKPRLAGLTLMVGGHRVTDEETPTSLGLMNSSTIYVVKGPPRGGVPAPSPATSAASNVMPPPRVASSGMTSVPVPVAGSGAAVTPLPKPFPVNTDTSLGPVLDADFRLVSDGSSVDIKWRMNEPFSSLLGRLGPRFFVIGGHTVTPEETPTVLNLQYSSRVFVGEGGGGGATAQPVEAAPAQQPTTIPTTTSIPPLPVPFPAHPDAGLGKVLDADFRLVSDGSSVDIKWRMNEPFSSLLGRLGPRSFVIGGHTVTPEETPTFLNLQLSSVIFVVGDNGLVVSSVPGTVSSVPTTAAPAPATQRQQGPAVTVAGPATRQMPHAVATQRTGAAGAGGPPPTVPTSIDQDVDMSGLRGPAAPSDVLTTPLKLYGRLVRLGTAWGLDQPFVTVGWRMSGLRVLVPGGGRLMDWNETPRQLRLQEQSTVFMVRDPSYTGVMSVSAPRQPTPSNNNEALAVGRVPAPASPVMTSTVTGGPVAAAANATPTLNNASPSLNLNSPVRVSQRAAPLPPAPSPPPAPAPSPPELSPPAPPVITLKFRLVGVGGQVVSVDVGRGETMGLVKRRLAVAIDRVPGSCGFKFILAGKMFKDEGTVESYGFKQTDVIATVIV